LNHHRSIKAQRPTQRAETRGISTEPEQERCILVGLEWRSAAPRPPQPLRSGDYPIDESLKELAELARGAGAEVLGSLHQAREKPDPATLIGRGKLDELKNWATAADAGLILFDANLTPTQQRNLENVLDRRVIDRTQLILDIFAAHARTREGQLQVELAQLNYLLPRLTGRGAAMSRLGGGIGTRGPGETQLETDRRRIGRRIEKLQRDLERVRATRRLQRQKRSGVPLPAVALVGYTNAGKSTLFNALTQAGVLADDRLFATLDPTIRAFTLPSNRRILLSDTVGFIRNLPPDLIEAFRATLEEVTEAALILHVVDLSSAHAREQLAEVRKVLQDLAAGEKPQILVLNKADRIEKMDASVAASLLGEPSAERITVSALTGEGLSELVGAIERKLPADLLSVRRYLFHHDEGDRISLLYERGRVLERKDTPEGVEVVAEVAESLARRLQSHAIEESTEAK
jgi:GTP-binding protein HflX